MCHFAAVSLQAQVTLRPLCVRVKKLPIRSSPADPTDPRQSSDNDTTSISSDTEAMLSETDADQYNVAGTASHSQLKTGKPLIHGFKTPLLPPAASGKSDPKKARVIASIARKKKFLTGSPTSSCSFLSLRNPRRVKTAQCLPQPFVSPEIPMATQRVQEVELSRVATDVSIPVPPEDRNWNTEEEDSESCATITTPKSPSKCVLSSRLSTDVTDDVVFAKQSTAVANGDRATLSLVEAVLHTNYRHHTRKRTRAALKQRRAFLSDTDGESPVRKKASVLQDFNVL